METITMYRPVGPKELKLLQDSGFRRWPPRLPEQPIFYPVTNEQYAVEIASRWNVKDDGIGYVTRFSVRSDFMQKYDVQKVGGAHHTEWWASRSSVSTANPHDSEWNSHALRATRAMQRHCLYRRLIAVAARLSLSVESS